MTLTVENQERNIARIEIRNPEISHGFKMTELRMLPEEWQIIPFGLIATLRKTKVDPRTIGEKKIFCVELEHISQGTGVLEGNTFTSSKSSIKAHFCKGDILFGKLRAYLRKYWLANRNGVASTEIWPIIPNLNCSLSEYIFFIVQTDRFIEAASMAYGTHMPRSDWNAVAALKISLPPIPQQKDIAAVLSDLDSLINSLDQLITKKRNIKLAAMQQLLTGKQRLPGFGGKWEMKRFEDVITHCSSGSTPSRNKPEFYKGNIRWITSGELNYNRIIDTREKITKEAVISANLKIIPSNTFLMAITGLEAEGTRGACGIVGRESTTNQSIMYGNLYNS